MGVAATLSRSTVAAAILRCAALALLYFVAARTFLNLAIPPGYATPVWPPSGIAVGALLAWGSGLWPGVWLGAAAANYTVNHAPGLAAWIATGNTLEALAGVWLIRRFVNPSAEFHRPEDVVVFGVAAAAAALVAAATAVPGLVAADLLSGEAALTNGFTWWLGDTAGIVLLAPLLLAWTRPETAASRDTSVLEAGVFCAALLALTALVLLGDPAGTGRRPGAFALVVLAVWAGSRFQQRIITAVSLALVALAAWATTLGRGPFALDGLNDALLTLQAFACSVALVGLALHALRRQRDDLAVRLLREAEERFRTLVEHVRDYAIYILDAEGRVASWNRGAERIKGYRAEEILGRHFSVFYPPEQGAEKAGRDLHIAASEGRLDSEGWRLRKDGARFWALATITALRREDGELRGYAMVTRDMNDRKRAEEDLRSYANRLTSTSRRLLEVQEAERRRLAGELHDRVGPNLAALGMKLELLDGSLSAESHAAAAGVLEDSKALLQETVAAARAVMGELRPQVLVDYGLVAALRAMAGGFSRRTGIDTAVEGADGPIGLPQSVELAFFRIAQEALNNVGKHSRARRVSIRYEEADGIATLEIDDDGVGFDREHATASTADAGWGLIIMRERAEAAGARFSLETGPGRGVRVRVAFRL